MLVIIGWIPIYLTHLNNRAMFKSQEVLIAEIHEAFDSAQDRLLAQAKAILEEPAKVTVEEQLVAQAGRLNALGFTNARLVTDVKKKVAKLNEEKAAKTITRAEGELIMYYMSTYPFLKFLTEIELERICKKYNLVFAPVSSYIGDIPEKNIRDIETAQYLKQFDYPQDKLHFVASEIYIYEDIPEKVNELLLKGFEIPWSVINGKNGNNQLGLDEHKLKEFICAKYKVTAWKHPWVYRTGTINRESKNGLFIAAPKSDFDLKGLKQNKSGFFSVFETKVKDPIVFRYCRGGIQVLTKWGLEANDPALLLPNSN